MTHKEHLIKALIEELTDCPDNFYLANRNLIHKYSKISLYAWGTEVRINDMHCINCELSYAVDGVVTHLKDKESTKEIKELIKKLKKRSLFAWGKFW